MTSLFKRMLIIQIGLLCLNSFSHAMEPDCKFERFLIPDIKHMIFDWSDSVDSVALGKTNKINKSILSTRLPEILIGKTLKVKIRLRVEGWNPHIPCTTKPGAIPEAQIRFSPDLDRILAAEEYDISEGELGWTMNLGDRFNISDIRILSGMVEMTIKQFENVRLIFPTRIRTEEEFKAFFNDIFEVI